MLLCEAIVIFSSVFLKQFQMSKYIFPAGYNVLTSIPRMFKQIRDSIGTMEESMSRFNGTYSVHLGKRKYIITQDPGFIDHVLKSNHRNYHKSPLQTDSLGKFLGKGLLTSNGDYWLKQRRLIQPGFHAEKIHALYEIIGKTANDFVSQMREGRQNVYPMMNELAFRMVINTLFNIKVPESVRTQLGEFITKAQAFIIKDIRQPHKSWWFKISGEEKENLDRAAGARAIIRDIIRERKKSSKKFNDLLDMLLDARYEDNGEPMSEEQIIDEILVLIIAGHETTANALAWTLYLLAKNPKDCDALRANTKGLSLQACVTNEHLQRVIKESMRLYPPAYISDRIALQDDSFGGYQYPKGTVIILFYYGLHRDKKFWTEPQAFKPERFSKDNERERAKTYFPFGSGPRLCIGNNFAMAEMTIFLHGFIQRFRLAPTEIDPKLNPLVTLKPDQVTLTLSSI
jgi:cytochrome P450